MDQPRTYSPDEIRKILKKASELQTQKDLYGDKEGLTEKELIELAREVGIDKDSLLTAVTETQNSDLHEKYNWLKANSRIQSVSYIDASFDDEHWEEIVSEIRRVTAGIGKVSRLNSTYEWEQRKSDIGYKHITLSPSEGKTKLQMVFSWGPMRMLSSFIGVFFGAIIALLTFKGLYTKEIGLLFAPLGGLAGFLTSRVFLKSYYRSQKEQYSDLIRSISNKVRSFSGKQKIEIEDPDVYDPESESLNSASSANKASS